MFAVVLAGGFGTRFWPVTRFIAKPLLPLGGERIVDRIVGSLVNLKRLDGVFVAVNEFFVDQFREWVDVSGWDVELVVEPVLREEEKLGSVRAMFEVMRSVGDFDFLVVGGDNVFSLDFGDLVAFFEGRGSPVVAVFEVSDLGDVRRFGEVVVDEDYRVVSLREKPRDPKSRLVSTACYVFPEGTLGLLEEYVRGGFNVDSPGYFLEWLVGRVDVFAFPFGGFWFDVGSPRGYIDAFKAVNRGIVMESSAVVSDSDLGGSVYVGGGARVSGSKIVDSLVYRGSVVEDSVIVNSIVLSDVEIKGARVEWSVIGSNAVIRGVALRNSVIGDYSKVFS